MLRVGGVIAGDLPQCCPFQLSKEAIAKSYKGNIFSITRELGFLPVSGNLFL